MMLAISAVITTGCTNAPHESASMALPVAPAPAPTAERITRQLGTSLEGRPIQWHRFGQGPDVTLFIATIHGNEPAGTPLLNLLADVLAADPMLLTGRTVALLPIANPDGYASGSRYNASGIDLNRDFPAGNFRRANHRGDEPLGQPESRAIAALIGRLTPDRIISIHQPLGCVDYDGPAHDLADAMAASGPLRVRKLGARDGSLGSYVGETLGIPIITLELPGGVENRDPEALWRSYGPMLLSAIKRPQVARSGR